MRRDYFLWVRVFLFMTREEAVGKKFNKLLVTGWKRNGRRTNLDCVCDCGKLKVVDAANLLNGHTKSCGCHRDSLFRIRRTTHGQSETKTYSIWLGMKSRCLHPNNKYFKGYGGRGIKVCDRWLGDNGFSNFFADLGECPPGYSIEREDVNGDYEPGNCKWIPMFKQARNRTDTVWITFNGETKCIADWSEIKGIAKNTLRARIRRGLPTEMLFAPIPR